jgi:hypothetical protein
MIVMKVIVMEVIGVNTDEKSMIVMKVIVMEVIGVSTDE